MNSFPSAAIDIDSSIYRVKAGTFHLMADSEYFTGGKSIAPRSTGPRHMRWSCDLQMTTMSAKDGDDKTQKWEATMARVKSRPFTMRLYDPSKRLPSGKGAGIYRGQTGATVYQIDSQYQIDGQYGILGGATVAQVATAAERYADTLHLKGLLASSTVFKDGDHIEVGGNLYMVNGDAKSNSSGETTVRILWKLWKPALVGDVVNLQNPTGRFMLRNIDGGLLNRTLNLAAATLSAIEIPDS